MKRTKINSDDNLLGMMVEDSGNLTRELPNNKKLKELGEMVNELADLEEKVLTATEALGRLTARQRELSTKAIPDLFDEFGLSRLTLSDGTGIEIKRSYSASITEETRAACHGWLRKNKFDSLIKHNLTAKLKKGEGTAAKNITALFKKLGVSYEDKESVHPQTLNAFVREQIEAGNDFPQELFKVFPIRIAKVDLATF